MMVWKMWCDEQHDVKEKIDGVADGDGWQMLPRFFIKSQSAIFGIKWLMDIITAVWLQSWHHEIKPSSVSEYFVARSMLVTSFNFKATIIEK